MQFRKKNLNKQMSRNVQNRGLRCLRNSCFYAPSASLGVLSWLVEGPGRVWLDQGFDCMSNLVLIGALNRCSSSFHNAWGPVSIFGVVAREGWCCLPCRSAIIHRRHGIFQSNCHWMLMISAPAVFKQGWKEGFQGVRLTWHLTRAARVILLKCKFRSEHYFP